MKKLLSFAALAVMIMTFYGCPVGLDYPMGDIGKEKIDKQLIGTWICNGSDDDCEVKKLEIKKKDDTSYDVLVLERGTSYALETDKLTGWITELEGNKFFFIKPDGEEKYYHYMIKELDKNSLTTCDVSLLAGGIDAVTSTENLRKEVSASMKKAEYCAETLTWSKQ